MSPRNPIVVLRLKEVLHRTGLSRSAVYLFIQQGRFPESISLGVRAVGWFEHDIENWLGERVKIKRRNTDAISDEVNE